MKNQDATSKLKLTTLQRELLNRQKREEETIRTLRSILNRLESGKKK